MCGRLNVVDDPLSRFVSEQLGLDFRVTTNRDLRPTQDVQVVWAAGGFFLAEFTTRWGI